MTRFQGLGSASQRAGDDFAPLAIHDQSGNKYIEATQNRTGFGGAQVAQLAKRVVDAGREADLISPHGRRHGGHLRATTRAALSAARIFSSG